MNIRIYPRPSSQPVRPSLSSSLAKVQSQVEYHCFASLNTGRIDPLYNELCLVIAETLLLYPDSYIKINGTPTHIHLIQEVFLLLRSEHLRLVFNNLQNDSYKVSNKKAYLRSALYNSFFEYESNSIIGHLPS